MKGKTRTLPARSIADDPYPDTGETGETYERELPGILETIRARIQLTRFSANTVLYEQA
jgi:hypothetical protein